MVRKELLVFVFIVLLSLIGCSDGLIIKEKSNLETLKGVSVSPKSFGPEDFLDFMEKVKETQEVLLWAGDWIEISQEKAPITFSELAQDYNYISVMVVGHHVQSSGELLRPLNQENKQIYLESTMDFVKKYKPFYLGIGIEVNIFAEKNPKDFAEFVMFYNQIYEAIKKVSPETKVFTVFQLEKMKGLKMWEIEETKSHWKMLDEFKTDIVAFTTYPGLFYRNPLDIPENHYQEIKSYTTKPIAFTEIGWHVKSSPKGWESSESEQAEFVDRFFELTKNLNPEIVVWSFMYDQETIEPFDSMGMIGGEGIKRKSWNKWNEKK